MVNFRLMAAFCALMLLGCSRQEPLIANGEAVAGGNGATNLEQGWSRSVQDRAWFTAFGSRLIPTAWIRTLEQAGSRQRFMAAAHLDALGFLVQSPTAGNPNGFPVGFTQEADSQGRDWTGLGCAACHTGEVRYHGHRIRIGTAGWTDKSLLPAGLFYPDGVDTPEDRLRYYASRFPLVEIDSSYFRK